MRLFEEKILPNLRTQNVHLMLVEPLLLAAYRLGSTGLIYRPIKGLRKGFYPSNRIEKDRDLPLVFHLSDIQGNSA